MTRITDTSVFRLFGAGFHKHDWQFSADGLYICKCGHRKHVRLQNGVRQVIITDAHGVTQHVEGWEAR